MKPLEEVEEADRATQTKAAASHSQPARAAKDLEEVQPVTLFEPGERRSHNCRRCGGDFQARVCCCPSCQGELREILATSATSFQRAGFVVSRQSDMVLVTSEARQAMGGETESFAQLRGAALFVQKRDLLAACQNPPKVTGYATFTQYKSARPNLD